MHPDFDVIVIGGGPSGATAARFCAQAGLRTLLIEKERFPRYKPCGGCLSNKALGLLDFDLSPVAENMMYGAKITYRLKDPFIVHSKTPIAVVVMRDRFDQFLVNKALDEGVQFLEGERVVGVHGRGELIEVVLKGERKLSCEYLVGADGPGSIVARSYSLSPPGKTDNKIGLESEVPLEAIRDFPREEFSLLLFDFGQIPNGYGWVFPKKNAISIGVGGRFGEGAKIKPREYFADFVRNLKFVNERKVGRVIAHPLPCFYDANQRVSHGKVLLTGDAGCLMDPLTGEGIYYAVQSGKLAAEAIVQSKQKGILPSGPYERSVRSALFEELKCALRVSHVIYRSMKLSYRMLMYYPELGDLCLQVLSGQTTYQVFVVKVKERMKGLVKGHFGEKIKRAITGSWPR